MGEYDRGKDIPIDYRIERIALMAALRWAALLGLVVGLIPSLVLAGMVVLVARHLMNAFAALASFSLSLPAQAIGPLTLQVPPIGVDLVARLGWEPVAATTGALARHPWMLFLGVALGLTLASAMLALGVAGVGVLAYNRLAGRLGGIGVCLVRREQEW